MHINIYNLLGAVANVSSNLAFIPQIVRSYRLKRVKDVSITMFAMLFTTQLCWVAYAVPLHAVQLWISSLTEIILLIPIFIMWALYRHNDTEQLNTPACNDSPLQPDLTIQQDVA